MSEIFRMELSLEVKGYIQNILATKIFAWEKIKTFGKRVGVDTTDLEKRFSKRKACEYIVANIPPDRGELVIKTLLDMSKHGLWDKDYSEEILRELNSVMERTMNCKVDENGKIIPMFPWLKEKQDLILIKFNKFGFAKGLKTYEEALSVYRTSPKGALGLLRATIESLIDDILKSKGIASSSNQKENFMTLMKLGLLEEMDNQECPKCRHRKKDHEFNYSYSLYGLLSHYGSHKEQVTEELANFLFTSTITFIWFLLNRYEHMVEL